MGRPYDSSKFELKLKVCVVLILFFAAFLSAGGNFGQAVTVRLSLEEQSLEGDSWLRDGINPSVQLGVMNELRDHMHFDGDSVQIVIGLKEEVSDAYERLLGVVDEFGDVTLVNEVRIGGVVEAVVVEVPFKRVSSFIDAVKAANLSSYVEPNSKFRATFVPNDEYWESQWALTKIEADWAWNTTLGDPSLLVAVIDTGIDYNHPDLAPNYVPLGYDWVNNDTDPMDDNGHGTHCAGIIAAVINNEEGIAGLAQVRIVAEKALDENGEGFEDKLAEAIVHAVDCGAKILSNSWVGYGKSELIHEAVKYAYEHGVLVVAAAGNDASRIKVYPAGYEEVVAVAATDSNDEPASFTNYGDWVELAAPGVDIISTFLNGTYLWMSGTSMACPHIVGVAALAWSQHPNFTRDQLRVHLRRTAEDLGVSGFDESYGYGRVNARKAVELTNPQHDVLVYTWQTPPYVEPLGLGRVNVTVLNYGASLEANVTIQLTVNGTTISTQTVGLVDSGKSVTVGFEWKPTIEGVYNVSVSVVPVEGEENVQNNRAWTYIYVGTPVKAYVLDSAGTDLETTVWDVLNTNWRQFGKTFVYVDYEALNKENITYGDIAATNADVLIISCAFGSEWEFTDSEIKAIKQYTLEGHGILATAGTFFHEVPNNNKLAPLFGLNESTVWHKTFTDFLKALELEHPVLAGIPDPYTTPVVEGCVPEDESWDSNELNGGTYLALGHKNESAIVVYQGAVYISPWLESIPPYYHFHLQLLYNAILWTYHQRADKIAPTLQTITPSPYAFIGKPRVDVKWNATDVESGMHHSVVYLNGTLIANTTGMEKALYDLPEGTYNLTIVAYDNAGNHAGKQTTFFVDLTPPTAEILTPLNNSYVQQSVRIKVSSRDRNFHHADLYIDGELVESFEETAGTHDWNTTLGKRWKPQT